MWSENSNFQWQTKNWIKYSGVSICFTLNPWHWRLLPTATKEFEDVWQGPNQRTWYISWLMLTIRVWVDDGSW